jgi:hypothetical protein
LTLQKRIEVHAVLLLAGSFSDCNANTEVLRCARFIAAGLPL